MKVRYLIIYSLCGFHIGCSTMPSYYENETEFVEIILEQDKNYHKRPGYSDFYFDSQGGRIRSHSQHLNISSARSLNSLGKTRGR